MLENLVAFVAGYSLDVASGLIYLPSHSRDFKNPNIATGATLR
jgi:hypothetical protein